MTTTTQRCNLDTDNNGDMTMTTLQEEIQDAKRRQFNSAKWSEITEDLLTLSYEHGDLESGPWALVRTALHGGGVLSRHRTATRALEAARRYRSDCTCGCCDVVRAEDVDKLPSSDECSSPYAVCR